MTGRSLSLFALVGSLATLVLVATMTGAGDKTPSQDIVVAKSEPIVVSSSNPIPVSSPAGGRPSTAARGART